MVFIRNLATGFVGNQARKHSKGGGLMGFGLGMLAARIATRSIPGALLVGGAIVAKALYNRSKENEIPAAKQIIVIDEEAIEDEVIEAERGPVSNPAL